MARIQAVVRSPLLIGRRSNWVAAFTVLFLGSLAVGEEQQFTLDVQLVGTATAAATASPPATHQQVKVIHPTIAGNWKLASFCLTKDGKIAAVLDRDDQPRDGGLFGAAIQWMGGKSASADAKGEDPGKAKGAVSQLCILDADGKLVDQFPLDFKAEAVNLCADGNLALGGDGTLARYDLKGKELARAESPHVIAARKDPVEMKQKARDLLEEQRASMKEALKSMEAQKEELAKKDNRSLSDEERQMKQQIDQIIAAYKQAAQQGDQPIRDEEVTATVDQLLAQGRRINAVAASDKHFYCTAPASKGYGYSVWRTDLDFGKPQRIADGLSGCCGQMDIQCCGDDVVVSENSRKRVLRYDAEGKQLAAWGKASREGEGDTFGSCCNPMNTRAVGDQLYVSDSDGRVRLFTLDGTYKGEVGKANVQPGCKSSIVDISPDGSRLYYIDVQTSGICVLDRQPAIASQASRQ